MMTRLKPLIIVVLLFIVWMITPLGSVPMTFIKNEVLRIPYTLFFFGILLICVLILQKRIESTNWVQVLFFAAICGHFISIISLLLAQLVSTDGIEKLASTFRSTTLLEFALVQVVFSAALGGWLIALLAVFVIKLSKR